MATPVGWRNPISAPAGQRQQGIDPRQLRPARRDLIRSRLEFQRSLLRAGTPRLTPILVTRDAVIVDGHHAVRAAAEEGRDVEVLVCDQNVAAASTSILGLPVR